jgi:Domain of unknown function (DUF4157)
MLRTPPVVDQVLSSPGQPLPANVADEMGSRFQFDFGRVRIHSDTQAAESAKQVGARAYTVGQHVVFGAGRYRPATDTGNKLLAHELTHVVQQHADVSGRREIPMLDSTAGEAEAHRAASMVTRGQGASIAPLASAGPVLQRDASDAGTAVPTPNIDSMPMGMYVDAYDEAYYDIDYKSVKGNLSKWIKVFYSYGSKTSIDINIDSIGDETEDAMQMSQDMFDHVGDGGRVFPKKMNRSTTPKLWDAKRHVLQIMDDYNALFILGGAFSAVWLIVTMGIGATGGSGGRGGGGSVRRPVPRGRMPGSTPKEPAPESPGAGGARKQGEATEAVGPEQPASVGGMKAQGPVPKNANGKAVWGQGETGAREALRNLDKNGLPASGGSRENLEGWQKFYRDAQAGGKGGETAPLREELLRRMLEMMKRQPPPPR